MICTLQKKVLSAPYSMVILTIIPVKTIQEPRSEPLNAVANDSRFGFGQ